MAVALAGDPGDSRRASLKPLNLHALAATVRLHRDPGDSRRASLKPDALRVHHAALLAGDPGDSRRASLKQGLCATVEDLCARVIPAIRAGPH